MTIATIGDVGTRLLGNGALITDVSEGAGTDASSIISGTLDPARLPPIDASLITGNLTANVVVVGDLDAGAITSGTIDPARLPPLFTTDIPFLISFA